MIFLACKLWKPLESSQILYYATKTVLQKQHEGHQNPINFADLFWSFPV